MEFAKLKYTVKESLRQKGAWYFLWRVAAVAFVLWMFWPTPEPGEQDIKNPILEEEAADLDEKPKDWQQLPEADRDLRKILTTTQSTFYWDSFNWMMEYGKALKPKSFESKIIKLMFVMDETQEVEIKGQPQPMSCRNFREKLVVMGKANTRIGVACRRGLADWCKQLQGEKMLCRTKKPTGMDAYTDEMFDSHNFNIRLNRNLNKLPSF